MCACLETAGPLWWSASVRGAVAVVQSSMLHTTVSNLVAYQPTSPPAYQPTSLPIFPLPGKRLTSILSQKLLARTWSVLTVLCRRLCPQIPRSAPFMIIRYGGRPTRPHERTQLTQVHCLAAVVSLSPPEVWYASTVFSHPGCAGMRLCPSHHTALQELTDRINVPDGDVEVREMRPANKVCAHAWLGLA